MEGCIEQRDDGWALVLPGQADGLQEEVAGFSQLAAQQALRLLALHAAIVTGQPPEEVQRLRGELEVRAGKPCRRRCRRSHTYLHTCQPCRRPTLTGPRPWLL